MAPKTPRYSNVTTATRESITFDTADPRYKLARKVDMKTGSYGSRSVYSDPRRLSGETNNRFRGTDPGFGRGSWNWTGDGVQEASQRSTNKAVTVEARTVPGSTRQTLGNRARVTVSNAVDRFGKGVSAAKGAAGKGTAGAAGSTVSNAASSSAQSSARSAAASAVGKVVSSSASGGPSVGWYRGGFGVGVSAGGLDLGVGFASVSYNFSNPNESAIGGAFNTLTIKGTQEGCTIFLDYQFLGKSYFKETRQADECSKGEEDPGQQHPPSSEEQPPGAEDSDGDPSTNSIERSSSEKTTTYNLAEPTDIWVYSETSLSPVRDSFEVGWGDDAQGTARLISYRFVQNKYLYLKGVSGEVIIKENIKNTKIPFYDIEATSTRDFIWAEVAGNIFLRETTYTISINGDSFKYLGGKTESKARFTIYNVNNWRQLLGYWRLTTFWHYNPRTGGGNFLDTWRFLMTAQNGKNVYRQYLHNDYSGNFIIKFDPQKEPNPFATRNTSTPRTLKEPMQDRQQILMERIYIMLGGDTFWENGLAIPNQMFTPEGEGYTRTKSYNGVAHLLFDTLDHRTPGQVEYKLPNGMEYKSINAQGYFQDLGANVAETLEETKKKESNNSQVQNYLTRTAFINSQILKILIQTNRIVRAILSFLNVPVSEEVENVDIPFDMSLGGKLGKKGFGSPKELDQELEKLIQEQLKTDPKAEKITAQFGNNGQTKITTVKVKESAEGGDFWWFIKQNLRGK